MPHKPIIIGADHAGIAVKNKITDWLTKNNIPFIDVGGFDKNIQDDYPDYAQQVAKLVKKKQTKGILICGSGTGMVIAANKQKGIRAAFAYDAYGARMARFDNDANILALRGRRTSSEKSIALVKTFLDTPFSGLKRHKRRIAKLE